MTLQGPTQVIAAKSRIDRVAGRGIRERDRRLRDAERRRPNRREVDGYDAFIARLCKVHQVEFERIDWDRLEAEGPVVPAVARDAVSSVARQVLANYRPSLFDAVLGLEREKRRALMDKVVEAAKADAELYGLAKAQADAHNRMLSLAEGVRALKVEAIAGVLNANGAAAALKDVVEGFRLYADGANRLIGQIDLWEFDALPEEACTTAGYAPVTQADRCEIQLANACAVVLRAAVEVLQATPVPAVEILARLCRPGGLVEADLEPVLHMKVTAESLRKLQLHKLDAAPTVAALGAQIDWNSSRGLAPIRIDDPALLRLTAPRVVA